MRSSRETAGFRILSTSPPAFSSDRFDKTLNIVLASNCKTIRIAARRKSKKVVDISFERA